MISVMIRATVIALALLLSAPGPAGAEPLTGNQLYSECERSRGGFCLGYLIAWAEMFDVMKEIGSANVGRYCRPDGVTNGQGIDIAIAYLRDRPERRHEPAFILLLDAFEQAFPCG